MNNNPHMMMASLGKLVTSRQSAPILSITSKSPVGASLSRFSTAAPAAAMKKPSPKGNFGRFVLPTTIVPSSTPAPITRRVADNSLWRAALQDLQKKQKEEINGLEKMLDSLRIARLPAKNSTPTTVVPTQPTQQTHTFQVMNRNARKPKRANHGKRPCSRIRRRFKTKKWANTSRRG